MHPITQAAFLNEMEKLAASDMEKVAIRETLRIGKKALKAAFLGGTDLSAPKGMLQPERTRAVSAGNTFMGDLKKRGIRVHRARVKSPSSLKAGGHTSAPDDLLGMQAYARSPEEVENLIKSLKASGATISGTSKKTRPGYHGVNIKGTYQGTPFEMQASPGRISNMGQVMEHSLGYKVGTEAPNANRFDKWVGKKVAPKMVNWNEAGKVHPSLDPSWLDNTSWSPRK
jgi:hypothetical protein